jgi:hypothetical protein
MPSDLDNGNWIPLVEFSVKKGISLSTLRRYIKSNKIPWKLLEGRYLVLDDGSFTAPRNHEFRFPPIEPKETTQANTQINTDDRIRLIEQELNAAHEEIAELKTLVAFYEEKWAQLSKK